MLIVASLLVGYIVVRIVTWLRSSANVEALIAGAVLTSAVRRQRLGQAESVGVRVRDLTGFVDARRRRRRRRAFWAFVIWAVVPCVLVASGWSPWWGAVVIAVLLVATTGAAVGSFVAGVASSPTFGTKARGILLFAGGTIIVYGGSALALWGAQQWGWPWPDPEARLVNGLSATYLGVGAIALCAWGFAVSIRRIYASNPVADDLIRSEGTTLWLRSFGDDDLAVNAVGPFGVLSWVFGFRVRLEELIARWTLAHGPLVAIGKPGEPLPPLGAIRTYVGDDEWQRVVEDAVKTAGVIVVLAGSSGGLGWEVDHVTGSDRRSRVLVLLPPLPYEQSLVRLANLRRQLKLSDLEALDEIADGTSTQFALSVVAVGISATGRSVYYSSYGRSAMDLEAAVQVGVFEIRGMSDPPLHGRIQRDFDSTFPLSPP